MLVRGPKAFTHTVKQYWPLKGKHKHVLRQTHETQCAFYSIIKYVSKSASHASCKWAQNTHVLSTLVPLLRLLRGYSSKHTNRPAALSLLRIHTNDIYKELSIDTVSFDTLDEYMRKWHENLGLPKNTSKKSFIQLSEKLRKALLEFKRIHAKRCELPISELTSHSNYSSSQINW